MTQPLFKPASKKQAMFLQSNATVIVFGGAAGCLRADAEYLSPNGWVSISKYDGGLVAQYDSNKDSLEFVTPDDYIKLPQKEFRRMAARGLDFILSEEHKVPFWSGNNPSPKILTWAEVLDRHDSASKGFSGKIKTSFTYDGEGIDLNEGELRLQIAVQADGRIVKGGSNNYTQMRFAKKRKYDRLKWILDTWGLPYKDNGRKDEERYSTKESFEIIVYPKYADKTFDSKYYKASREQLKIIREEVGHWDGTIYDTGLIRYSTTNKKNADFIQFVFHALGYNSSYTVDKAKGNHSECYQVDCVSKGKGFRSFVGKGYKQDVEVVPSLDGYKYCFTMPKGMFLARQDNKVFITHNSGKTHQSLLRFLRWAEDPDFVGYVIRKESTSLKGGGGAFDEAQNIYPVYDPKCKVTTQPMRFRFRSGASIDFLGLDGDRGKKKIQGKQISAAFVDEATHLTEDEVEWIISRLRTKAKMSPSIWLTCNPDPTSFIFNMIKDYYLYPEGTVINGELVEGRPIPERNGVVRYYLKMGNDRVWGDTEQELIDQYSHFFAKEPDGSTSCKPISFQFIGATCYDNPPLLEADPMYLSKLQSLNRVDKERLLYGCWTAREEDAGYFKRKWTPVVKSIPKDAEIVKRVRCFDLASSVPSEAYPNPDWTVGVLMCKTRSGEYYIEHVERFRMRAGEVENAIIEIVRKDREHYGSCYKAYLPQDPASAGQIARKYWSKLFAEKGIPIYFNKVGSKNGKLKRAEPFFASAENGLVYVVEGEWNSCFFDELESFDDKRSSTKKDDQVDANADCFNLLATTKELPKLNAKLLVMS